MNDHTSARDRQAKATHNLHLATNADELLAMLKHRGIDLGRLLEPYASCPQRYGILVVGSIADGVATEGSDIDILVLAETDADGPSQPSLEVRRRWSREWLIYASGIEFNVEIVRRTAMDEGLRAFLEIAPVLYEKQEIATLPILGEEASELLHRLRSGWAIYGTDIARQWRDEFMVTMFPLYVSLYHYIAYHEAFEDAYSLRNSEDGSFSLAARESAMAAVISLLALHGITNHSRKWSVRLAQRWLKPRHTNWLDRLLPVVFPARSLTATQRMDIVTVLEDAGKYVRDQLDNDPELTHASTRILDQIHYTM